jgi:Cu+-exporting ATPase
MSMTAEHHHHAAAGGAIDPVCGMTVDPHTAKHRADYRGHTYYFCAAGCRTKFVADPQKYLGAREPEPVIEGATYTCPMHPEIRQIGPGACPICGMALEPEMPTADSSPNAELVDMTRRFWIGLAFALPVMVIEMGGHFSARTIGSSLRCRIIFNSPLRPRSCCGRAGRFSCAARNRWSRAISTCSR